MKTLFCRRRSLWCPALLLLSLWSPMATRAGVEDCIGAVFAGANPNDLKLAAQFAANHPQCLTNLLPPEVVPYAILSASLDAANQSGALNQVGLGFGNSFDACTAKFDPAKTALKAMAPVLQPICGTVGVSCSAIHSSAAAQVNAQLAEQIPVLSLLPCACAAATSGLGVSKIAELVNQAKGCGSTVAQVGGYLLGSASGAYNAGKSAVNTVGCAVLSFFGGCSSAAPPPTGISEAAKWCAPYGGIKAAISLTNQPNDYSVQCNDGAACVVKPGQKPRCMTAAEKAANQQKLAQQVAAAQAANEAWCNTRRDQLKEEYQPKCSDGQCKTGVAFVATGFRGACIQHSNGDGSMPPFDAALWAIQGQLPFIENIQAILDESILRDPQAGLPQKMVAGRCHWFLGRPGEMLCETTAGFEACKTAADAGQMKSCRSSVSQEVYLPQARPPRPLATRPGQGADSHL